MLGRYHKDETRDLISKRLKGKQPHDNYGSVSKFMMAHNPMYNIEVRKLHKECMNEWAKQRKMKELPFGGWPKERPNKEEKELLQFLNGVIPNKYEYVGDGKVWINGLNPDFICRGKRKVIEYFGNRWHEPPEEKKRVEAFKKQNYDCLVIWGDNFKGEDKHELVEKIQEFTK